METHPRKLLVIIAEAALEKALVEDARRLGAQGYTVHDVRGGGRGGTRAGDWEADRSIELKVIAGEAVSVNTSDTYGRRSPNAMSVPAYAVCEGVKITDWPSPERPAAPWSTPRMLK